MNSFDAWELDNGLRVLYQRDATFPLVCATLLFGVGSRHESPAQAGLCSITIDLLMQGTRRRTARELATVMESVGASIGTQVHEDYSEMGFVVPSAEIDRALGVMSEVLKEPDFPREEVLKEKAHVLAGLTSRKDAIFNVAYDALNKALYGSHPYGRPLEGYAKTVSSFSRADFHRWYGGKIRPEQCVLSLSGPMRSLEMKRRLQKTLGTWRSGSKPDTSKATFPLVRPLTGSVSQTVSTAFEQAYLVTAWQAPGAGHPDHIPLKVLNTIFGGGMSSLLFATLREKSGLAYEVSSFYPTRLDGSQWVIYLGLPQEKLHTASVQLEKLLQQVARVGPTVGEVNQARAMIRGAFLMDRQSHRRQAWYAAWWEFTGRGRHYGEEFLKAIDAVTPKQLHTLMKKMIEQPRVTVMVVPKR